MIRRFLLTAIVILAGLHLCWGQALLSYEKVGSISADSLTSLFAISAQNDIDIFSIQYTTLGSDGLLDTASGLFVLPLGRVKGIVAYQHGTTGSPDVVPSNLNIGDALIAYAYASQGYMCSAADYLGLGSSRGFHPYVHASTEAQAGIDMLLASQQLVSDLGQLWPSNIFVSGYSQGGHGAMAMAQAIQERLTDDLWLTASTPMSGPYDVSGGMRNLILSDQEYLFVGYAVYVLVGYQEVYGDIYQDLSDVIKPAYLEDVTKFSRHEINLSLLNSNLTDLLIDNVGRILPREIFTDQFIAELTDTTSLITHRLKENDTYRWVPETPMRLYYCESDEQVLFQNSITAVTYMTENGAEDVKAFNLSSTVDHAFCAIFAVTSSIAFLDSFDVISSAEYEVARDFDIFMPNPVRDLAHLNSEIAAASQLTVFNLQGQTVAYFSSVPQFLDLRDLPQGIYMVRINSEKGIFTQRLVKQ